MLPTLIDEQYETCMYLDALIHDEYQKAKKKGLEKGMKEGTEKCILALRHNSFDSASIAHNLDLSLDYVEHCLHKHQQA